MFAEAKGMEGCQTNNKMGESNRGKHKATPGMDESRCACIDAIKKGSDVHVRHHRRWSTKLVTVFTPGLAQQMQKAWIGFHDSKG